MSLSTFEVAMQTIASVVSDYLEDEKGVPVMTKNGMDQLVNEQFPHCEKEEMHPRVYQIRFGQKEISPRVDELRLQLLPRFDKIRLTWAIQKWEFNTQVYFSWDKFLMYVAEILAE